MALPWDRLDKKIDRKVLVQAVGLCALGWLAVPLLYILLKRKKEGVKEENEIERKPDGDNNS